MDCRTALEILEVARPRSDDLAEPELAEAAAHVEAHADCREEFERRQALDLQIGAAIRQVPVPAELKARLLAELVMAADAADAPQAEAQPGGIHAASDAQTANSRRNWLRLAAGIAACFVAGVVAWRFLPAGPQPIDAGVLLNQVADSINQQSFDFDRLPNFDELDNAELPLDWQAARRLTVHGPRSYRPTDNPESAVAMYRFSFQRRGQNVAGYLLVLPLDVVRNAPAETSLGDAAPVYPRRMSACSWTSGEFVYFCIVPRGGGIDALRSLLAPRTA